MTLSNPTHKTDNFIPILWLRFGGFVNIKLLKNISNIKQPKSFDNLKYINIRVISIKSASAWDKHF